MHVFALGYLYTCKRLLTPVVEELRRRGHVVSCLFLFEGEHEGRSFDDWCGLADERALLLAADQCDPGHQVGLNAIAQARAKGVPVVSVQHGAYPEWREFAADVVCAWSAAYTQHIRAGRVVITGNPALDNPPDRATSRAKVAERAGWTDYTVLTTSWVDGIGTPPETVQAAIDKTSHPLIARPHPAERILGQGGWYRELTAPHGIHLWEGDTPECGLYELLSGAQCVMGWSTALVEAESMGTPVHWIQGGSPAVPVGGAAARVADEVEQINA